jgi:hypothetical protein
MNTVSKDPDEKKDYGFDWSAWLSSVPPADTISSSAWVLPTGITQSTPAPSNDTTTTTIWLSGGTAGASYTVVNRITTAAGRIAEAAFRILCRVSDA